MKKNVFVLLAMALASSGFSQTFRTGQFSKPEDVFPKNWKILQKAVGDLDKDNQDDVAFIVTDTKKENYLKNEGLGPDTLNTNPRFLVVMLKKKDKFSYNPLFKMPILTEGDTASPCLEDPIHDNSLEMKNGTLRVKVQYFLSCGSWNIVNEEFIFRFQDDDFMLIGLESSSVHRASGETTGYSYNFSTRKVEVTTGGNEFNAEEDHPKTELKKLKADYRVPMSRFSFDTEYDYQ